MTFPAASFTAVAPPPGGLTLAFTSARRRRNGKAAVTAFGGAVAIASVLSLLAPPGQSLVQEPPQPAQGGLLTGLPDAPRHGAPAPAVRTTVTTSPVLVPTSAVTTTARSTGPRRVTPARTKTVTSHDGCGSRPNLICVTVRPADPGGPTMHASACPAAVSVTVEYDAPTVVPRRTSVSRTVEAGSCTG
jgi:hypothetical protein